MADNDTTFKIYLIRHGETQWSLSGQHTGNTEIALTAYGEAQARALGQALSNVSFSHVFSSPRSRARKTCELAGLSGKMDIAPDLVEWDYGDYEGQRTADIVAERPDWDLWRDGAPGGETPYAVAARADRFLARLGELSGNIAVFSHGHFSCALAARWIEQPIAMGKHYVFDPASYSVLGFPSRHAEVRVIVQWNVSASPVTP